MLTISPAASCYRFVALTVACCTLLLTARSAQAQILYSQLVSTNPARFQLRQVNADGSGDAPVALPFANVGAPIWSRDGRVFAVNASDPNRPNDRSINAYVIDAPTGGIQQITGFTDVPNDGSGFFQWIFSQYAAFSPDRSAIAIESLIVSGGPSGSTRTTPRLEVYSTAAPANPTLVHVYSERTGLTHHGGEGVDWHPSQNVLVTPFETTNDQRQVTALFLLEPVAGAVNQGRFQQITFPAAGTAPDFSGVFGEHDYQPRFSPNGVGLAYVRSFQNRSFQGNEPDIQSIRILNLNTGAETEVLRFNPGAYISRLEWSPDGSALAFDVGQQESGPNGLQQNAVPQSLEIYVVNVDGSGLRLVRSGGASTPAWSDTAPVSPSPSPSASPQPTPQPSPQPSPSPSASLSLGNISTRLRVGTGDDALIGGFIITGDQPKEVIIRAIAPSLGAAGVQGALSDPVLELNGASGTIASNDNWQQGDTSRIPNGFAPNDPRESVVVTTLNPGSYTAVVRGAGGGIGIGLIEAYDLSPGGGAKLANISTRGPVESGANVLIGGFIAAGESSGSAQVVVRAIGPSLGAAGVNGALQDPTLELYNGNGTPIAANDNWKDSQAAELQAIGIPPNDDREAAIVASLAPGAYTAVVGGKNGTMGVGLVEVYHVQ